MSYFSQMVALTIHNFTSAAVGIAIAAALVRGIARQTAKTIGNFWVDVVRVTYYLLVPICLVFALFLVSQGMIQNFKPYTVAKTYEPYTIQVPRPTTRASPVLAADGKTPVMVDQSSTRRPSCRARWPRRSRSRCSARTAAATSTPTPRIRSRIPRRSPISSRCSRSSRSRARSPTTSAAW
jgi:hypothetical protein